MAKDQSKKETPKTPGGGTPNKGGTKRTTSGRKRVSRETDGYRPNLLTKYHDTVIPMLIQKPGYRNSLEVPRLEKISLNIGIGRAKEDPGSLEHALDDLTAIAGQRAVVTRARKAISNFKIRENDPVGCSLTLRHWKMYEFFERLITIALPRVRDFTGLSVKSFDGKGNFSFGIEEQIVFPEIDYDKIDKIRGLDVSLVTTAEIDEEGYELLKALGFPFKEPDAFKKLSGEMDRVETIQEET